MSGTEPQGSAPVTFGWANYWRMYRKRGIRLPLYYFFNNHLFDLLHGTDTHVWLPKDNYSPALENIGQGTFYMSSWTNEVTRLFTLMRKLVDRPEDYTFLDIGCGKGKVVLLWEQLLRKHGSSQKVVGIDYYQPLLDIAEVNHRKLFGTPGTFIRADATAFDYAQFGGRLIVYMFNPFDGEILGKVLDKLEGIDVYLIYNNPVFASVAVEKGFAALDERHGFHPNCQTIVMRRKASV